MEQKRWRGPSTRKPICRNTIAAITGSIAEAFYGVDEELRETALSYLDDYLLDIYEGGI